MKENKLSAIFTWFLTAATFLLPVFFIPYLFNPFTNSKIALTFLIVVVSSFAFIGKSLKNKSWEFIRSPFILPLIIFAIMAIASSLINHQYPDKQLLGFGGIYLSFVAIVLFVPSLIKEKFNKAFIIANNTAALILSILSIFQLFGIGLAPLFNRFSILGLPNNLSFSLTGTAFITVQFLSVVLLSNVFDQKSWKNSLFNKIAIIFITVALGINIWAVLPGGEANFQSLSFISSLNIAKNSLALTKNALIGFGPDSYDNAYNILKPIWVNGFNYWQFIFDSAFNFPLTIIVSTGLVAFLAYLITIWKVFASIMKDGEDQTFLKVFIACAILWQFLSPINLVLFILLAIALAAFTKSSQEKYNEIVFNSDHLSALINHKKLGKLINIFFVGTNSVLLFLVAFFLYISTRTLIAYHLLYKSSENVTKNEIAKAYDYQKKAKDLAPRLDFVRRSYSSINLQIAIALSNKTDIKPAEQEQVLQLINQAIGEAKAATALDQNNYQNWLTLAQIYMQLIGTTEQAEQEALNALSQAAAYNPNNPEIRIALGQLFLNAKKYTEAITFFNQAVERKPDLFAAHYYLATALAANKQLTEAKGSLINSLNLLNKDSEDYKAVEKQLESLNAQIESENKGKSNQTGNASDKELDSAPASSLPASNSDIAPVSTASGLSNLLNKENTEPTVQEDLTKPKEIN